MRFIVVDGLDGCGKDTHARRIGSYLESKGEKVFIISHPSERRLGRIAKKSLQGSGKLARLIATLFYTADVLISVRLLKKQENGTIIFVRYLLGTAYLPKSLASTGYKIFRNLLPFPNMAFFIDITPEVAIRRIQLRDHKREMFETMEKLIEVRKIAKSLVSKEWIIIDNSVDGEKPFEEVRKILESRMMNTDV